MTVKINLLCKLTINIRTDSFLCLVFREKNVDCLDGMYKVGTGGKRNKYVFLISFYQSGLLVKFGRFIYSFYFAYNLGYDILLCLQSRL
jgi:hypothetical protein